MILHNLTVSKSDEDVWFIEKVRSPKSKSLSEGYMRSEPEADTRIEGCNSSLNTR